MSQAAGDCSDPVGDNFFWLVGVVESAIAKLAVRIVTHGPEAVVRFKHQAEINSTRNRGNIAGDDFLWLVGAVESAVAELAIGVVAHAPQAVVGFEKQAVSIPGGYRNDPARDNLLRSCDVIGGSIAQFAISIPAHAPKAAIRLRNKLKWPWLAATFVTPLATICFGTLLSLVVPSPS